MSKLRVGANLTFTIERFSLLRAACGPMSLIYRKHGLFAEKNNVLGL